MPGPGVMAAWFAVVVALGCGSAAPAQDRPADRLEKSLDARDYRRAYAVMPEAFRRTYSEDEFRRMMRGETVLPARASAPAKEPQEGPDDYPVATPRQTVRSFVRAYRSARWDVIITMVPARYREKLSVEQLAKDLGRPENEALLDELEAHLDGPIEVNGDRARLPYGARNVVELVREDGRWCVEDLD